MMARSSSLWSARLALGCLAVIFCMPGLAQEKVRLQDVNQRLVRVERVLDQSLLELLQQVESLKREIRILRGELENQTYELGNARKRNRDLYLDTDQRITDLEKQLEQQRLNSEGADTTGSLEPLEPGGSDPVFVVSSDDSTPATGAAKALQQPAVSPQTVTEKSADPAEQAAEKAAYAKAYDLLASGNKQDAVAGFEAFLKAYPNGSYADNAWYWQGEARYAQREFDQAIALFETVINTFPNSPKVPDARLKIAYALYEQQRYAESREQLAAVASAYPGRAAGTLASRRLSEMDSKGL